MEFSPSSQINMFNNPGYSLRVVTMVSEQRSCDYGLVRQKAIKAGYSKQTLMIMDQMTAEIERSTALCISEMQRVFDSYDRRSEARRPPAAVPVAKSPAAAPISPPPATVAVAAPAAAPVSTPDSVLISTPPADVPGATALVSTPTPTPADAPVSAAPAVLPVSTPSPSPVSPPVSTPVAVPVYAPVSTAPAVVSVPTPSTPINPTPTSAASVHPPQTFPSTVEEHEGIILEGNTLLPPSNIRVLGTRLSKEGSIVMTRTKNEKTLSVPRDKIGIG